MPKQNLIIFIIMLIAMLAVRFYFERNKGSAEADAIKELEKLYSGLKHPISEYKFFSTGHPYTWTEYSKYEIETRVKSKCSYWSPGMWFSIYSKPIYQTEIDENAKRIFVVFQKKPFNFSSLKVHESRS